MRWQRRLAELVAFRNQHGHCRVPQNSGGRKGLGVWVANVRAQYARGALRPDRIQALNEMGFCWRFSEPMKRVARHG